MPVPPLIDEDETNDAGQLTDWLTLDVVAKRMHFPSKRALLAHLRRAPGVVVYQRLGSTRYFMRAQDVDTLMVPVDLTMRAGGVGLRENVPANSTFVQVRRGVNGRQKRAAPPARSSRRKAS